MVIPLKLSITRLLYSPFISRMSDDLALQMYEAQAELVETRQELERIRRENDELRNERAANHLMRTGQAFLNLFQV